MKERDRIWKLMARKLVGDATERELRALQALLKDHPEDSYSIQLLIDIWESSPPLDPVSTDAAFERHLRRLADYQRDQGKARP